MPVHETELRVRFSELDPYHHVNHAVYVTYFEAARVEALESVGIDLVELHEAGFLLVVSELQIRYRGSARGGDRLCVETEITELGGASTRWRQLIRRGDEILVEGVLRAGVTDLGGRPKRIPAELSAKLRRLTSAEPGAGAGPRP